MYSLSLSWLPVAEAGLKTFLKNSFTEFHESLKYDVSNTRSLIVSTSVFFFVCVSRAPKNYNIDDGIDRFDMV